jgi:hypothetical protein
MAGGKCRGEHGLTNGMVALATVGVIVVAGSLGFLMQSGGRGAPSSEVKTAQTSTSVRATTSTGAPATTQFNRPTTTRDRPTTTVPPGLPIAGTVEFLDNDSVWFEGSIDGQPAWSPKPNGASCSGTDGYADLSAGGTVVISNGSGLALAQVPLAGGQTINEVKNTQSERDAREILIDSIYSLRIAVADSDPLQIAQLNLDRANLRVYDQNNPGPTPGPFEGRAFGATWCRLTFATPALPISNTYSIAVTHRGVTTFTAQEIRANANHVNLVVGS